MKRGRKKCEMGIAVNNSHSKMMKDGDINNTNPKKTSNSLLNSEYRDTMNIKLYNSLSRNIEDFKPINEEYVGLYTCGPTVYNIAHIGNMRAFLTGDLIARVLKTVGGYNVKRVMNITNIDDKTIRDAKPGSGAWKSEMGKQTDDPKENVRKLTLYYENEFKKDIAKLKIDVNDYYSMPRATDHIELMQDLITKIVENGYGYIADGSVYFDVSAYIKDEKYGKLFKIDFDNFRKGERVDSDEYEKESISDFVLWKAAKDGEPVWEYVLNGEKCDGRPGWHIECSAMEEKILGVPFDIHSGGIDLKFPHHEDEIAQSKAGYGVEPTNYWCHNEFLEINGAKMSKSAGNFFTLRDLEEKGFEPVDVRYEILAAHYRTKTNFTFEGIEASKKTRLRLQEYIYCIFDENIGLEIPDISKLREDVFGELANDLHTPKALGKLFTFVNKNHPHKMTSESKKELLNFLKEINEVFAVWNFEKRPDTQADIPKEVQTLAEQRFAAKKEKNWSEADRLRDEISAAGYTVKDTKDGYELIAN